MPSVAIVGAGFSGALLALHLVKLGPPDLQVSLIDRAGGFGRGLAYATRNPRHLLNVRVGNMSAWPSDPGHLARWLAARGDSADPAAFISRGTYGAYLAQQLQAAISGVPGRLLLEHDAVTDLTRKAGRLRLTLALGRTLETDAVVLAMGNLPPAAPPGTGIDALRADVYAADPWDPSALMGLDANASVLLLGTGLTMVDTAIELEARGHRGPILALSRRGLAPRRHDGAPHAQAPCAKAADVPLSRRLAALRRRSREAGWRVAFDEQRGSVQAVWRAASDRQRRQFLRHLRPWWDVHRHRMAPEVADWLERHPRLSIVAGRLRSATVDGDFVKAVCRPRGSAGDVSVRVARIVNCSGFGADISRTRDRLLRGLIETGAVRIDPLDLGLDVDVEGRVLDACSRPDPALWAIGPITRGALWEITAVPDIRAQVASVAAALVASLGMEATVAARGSARLGSETIHTTF